MKLRSQWAIDSQVQLMFLRVRLEMLVICDDAEFLKRYASDLKKLDKRIALYVIVRTPELAEHLGIRCYLGGWDIECGMFCPLVPDSRSYLMKLACTRTGRIGCRWWRRTGCWRVCSSRMIFSPGISITVS